MVANTSKLVSSLQPQVAPDGRVYYELEYNVILLFGLTEFKVQISWMHDVCFLIVLGMLYHLCIVSRMWKRGENHVVNQNPYFSNLTQMPTEALLPSCTPTNHCHHFLKNLVSLSPCTCVDHYITCFICFSADLHHTTP